MSGSRVEADSAGAYLERLCEWAAAVRFDHLPAAVVERAKVVLMDDLGAILGGSVEPEVTAIRERRLATAGDPCATLFAPGLPRADVGTAVEVNGIAGCWLELDEGYRLAVCHAGIYTLPAALAVAEARGASGRDLLLSLVVGYEVAARLATAYRFPPLVLHPHGVFAPVAAAAAVSKLAGYPTDVWRTALTSAVSMAPATPYRHATDGALARNLWVGVGGRAGVSAAEYAAFGVGGWSHTLDEVFVRALGATADARALSADLGVSYAIASGYHKKFACCQYAHSALAALLEIRARQPGREWANEIEAVEVETHPAGLSLDNREPATTLAAKFSLPHAVAATLLLGTGGRRAFTRDTLRAPDIAALRRNVVLKPHPRIGPWPADRPARVTVRFRDGSSEVSEWVNAPGDPVNPLSLADLQVKFAELARDALGDVDVDAVLKAIFALDQGGPVTDLRDAMVSRRQS